ncbi:MAG TPA: PIN domain-containing protein [Bryobacteraceae bacterium]|nr:PIN domain-containing protein [Bryobacteraceae bacterium]
MRVALDTNRLTDLLQGDQALAETLDWCDEVWVPPERGRLEAFSGKPTVNVLSPAPETAEHYARRFVQLKRAGTPIPDNDLWIAALAPEHNLSLVTRDRHFDCIPQLLRA